MPAVWLRKVCIDCPDRFRRGPRSDLWRRFRFRRAWLRLNERQWRCASHVAQAVSLRRVEIHASYQLALHVLLLAFGGFAAASHSRSRDIGGLTGIAFANTRSFTAQVAQVVKFCPAHVAFLNDVDVIDDRRVQREDSFYPDAEAGFPHRNRLARAPMFARNTDTLKRLQSFFGFRLFDT